MKTQANSHYSDIIMTTMASQITSLAVVYTTVYSDADQRKQRRSASLAFVWGIHRDRWIPRTKGQLRGKWFHLMTSSWILLSIICHNTFQIHFCVAVIQTMLVRNNTVIHLAYRCRRKWPLFCRWYLETRFLVRGLLHFDYLKFTEIYSEGSN